MSRTDQELILARAWAMLSDAERTAITDTFDPDKQGWGLEARRQMDKLAEDWIEELRDEKVALKQPPRHSGRGILPGSWRPTP